MALEVIGAGLGRTGTLSLKMALEQLGFAPCHHMVEVFSHPETTAFWNRAAFGEDVDWNELYGNYRATVDWPGCHFWRQLMTAYPDAKVILSARDPKRWFESMEETILKRIRDGANMGTGEAPHPFRFIGKIVAEDTFGGDLSEQNVIAAFERHVAAVKAGVAAERLLVFEAAQGWEPLCRFLGVPVPQTDYPRVNSREEFWSIRTPEADETRRH